MLKRAEAALRGGLRDSDTFGAVITKDHLIAFAAGAILAILGMWFIRQPKDNSGRMEQLLRDSMDHANWAEQRDADRQFMDSVFRVKDSLISSSREELEYAIHHRAPSRYADADSLHRAIRKEVGLDPQ